MLAQEFSLAVGAAQTGIRINTDEIPDAIEVIDEQCRKFNWKLQIWDATRGLQTGSKSEPTQANQPTDPLNTSTQVPSLLMTLKQILNAPKLANPHEPGETRKVITLIKNMHLIFQPRDAISSVIQHLIEDGKDKDKYIVGLMPAETILPVEVDPLFHVIDHELPDELELEDILSGITQSDAEENGEAIYEPEDIAAIVKAALGLTRLQAEGIFASSLVRHGRVLATEVWAHKGKILNREKLVELLEPTLGFADVGGMQGFKDFLVRLTQHDPLEDEDHDAGYKGVIAVGAPGVGKSLMAVCLGKELNIPTLMFNPGNLMGEHVGTTERNTRKFFQIVKRMAPCVCVGDEIAQTMGNGKNSNSAVDNRMLGTFLTSLNDIKEPVFWFFTSNDIEGMHPAFARAERIDAKIYVKLPNQAQRAAIWAIYLRKFFPKRVGGEADARHIEPDLERALKKLHTAEVDYAKIAAAYMATTEKERRSLLRDLTALEKESIFEHTFDDRKWTPAEIRACCRLARRLGLSLADASKRIGHECVGSDGKAMIDRLNEWASKKGALDSETGEVFSLKEDDNLGEEDPVEVPRKKVKRSVRKLAD